jgi:acetyl esterase/lipase
VEDSKNAVRWLRAHAKEYEIDPARIGAFGNSAGAHLAALLALAGPSAELEGDGTHRDQSSLVQAACVVAGPADLRQLERLADTARVKTLFGGPPETLADRVRRVSPVTYVRADAPAILLIHGSDDKTVPVEQSAILFKALQAVGSKKVTFLSVAGAGHNVFVASSPITRGATKAFFDSALGAP